MFSWLHANPKKLEQFGEFYTKLGFDVLLVTVDMRELLFPVSGSQKIAGDALKFLTVNKHYDSILLHGFSMGGYMWGECLVQIEKDPSKYEAFTRRVKGQIWDSMTGSKEIPIGQSRAIFPNNLFMQKVIRLLASFYLFSFYQVSTKHYKKAENYFNVKPLLVPALLMHSDTDQVATTEKSQSIFEDFQKLNIKTTKICFENSPHVGHFKTYKEAYTKAVIEHLKLCKLLE